jgi:putative oxidoreductase
MAGHGAQKLFGWFGGGGIKGTEQMVGSMGLQPSKPWALLAGLSEFSGGVFTLLGALNPLGTITTMGAMSMATAKAHWGKPIWNMKGGAELPVLNMAAALAIGLMRPGTLSVDHALGIRLPRRLILIPGMALVAAGVAYGIISSRQAQPQMQAQQEQPQPSQAQQARPQDQPGEEAMRVPETAAASSGPEPHEILNTMGVEPLTDERLEAGESEHYPG